MQDHFNTIKMLAFILAVFSVFTVTPSKIIIKTIQHRRFRIWGMKEDKYAKIAQIYEALYGEAMFGVPQI